MPRPTGCEITVRCLGSFVAIPTASISTMVSDISSSHRRYFDICTRDAKRKESAWKQRRWTFSSPNPVRCFLLCFLFWCNLLRHRHHSFRLESWGVPLMLLAFFLACSFFIPLPPLPGDVCPAAVSPFSFLFSAATTPVSNPLDWSNFSGVHFPSQVLVSGESFRGRASGV